MLQTILTRVLLQLFTKGHHQKFETGIFSSCFKYRDREVQFQVQETILAMKSHFYSIKDIRGWQFLTIETAETLYMVCICIPPEEQYFPKNIWVIDLSKNHIL